MRIMIVDDEIIIRTGLEQVIDWRELGMELLQPSASAEEALARIPQERPHILLTDIRMSGMTGLQLAEEAKRMLPELEVIILSGFDDFAYTQQAIRQEVGDYLLKTSRPEEIIQSALRAKRRIEERWTEQSEDRLRNKEARNRLFERLVEGGFIQENDRKLIRMVMPKLFRGDGHEVGYQAMMLAAEGWAVTESIHDLLLFAVDNMLSELLECETLLQPDRIIVVARAEGHDGIPSSLRHALDRIERLLKCKLSVAFGRPAERMEDLHDSYAEAGHAFSYLGLIGETCADYGNLLQRKGGKRGCSRVEELELSALLLRNDRLALYSWVQQFIASRTDDPHMTIESLDASIRAVSETAQRWLQRGFMMSGREEYAEESPPPASFKQGESPKDTLFRCLYAMMKHYHTRFGEGQTNHVHKAMAYIQEHVEADIGLQQVAKYVHVHPNHLSELFRKETGTTFSEYVTNLKIERAKELLASSPAKISEVAYRLGYEDVKYFGQLFKKCTGKTPSEFRIDYKG